MSAQFRGRARTGYVYVPHSAGGWKQRTTGTSDKRVVRQMERMVAALRDQPERWPLLDAVYGGTLPLNRLYAAWSANDVASLQARVSAVDLVAHVAPWLADYAARGGSAVNGPVYRQRVLSFLGTVCLAPDLTPQRVKAWLARLDVSSGTRRGYLMALRSFVAYLVETGVLATNPIRDVSAPKKNPPRLVWRDLDTDQRIVDAAPTEALRALYALIHGTGADLSATITHTRRGDVDLDRGVVRLRGTKTAKRDRHEVIIDPWALPALRDYLGAMLPTVRPWAALTRYIASWHHAAVCQRMGIADYTLRDARHSCAVRWRQAGRSFEWIAAQLGNSVYQVATVYARFTPSLADREAEAATITITQRGRKA